MKKIICLFVLILGFISEGRTQFAASSEIHYYVNVDANSRYSSVLLIKFYRNQIAYDLSNVHTLNDLGNNLSFEYKHYDEKVSNHKYIVYSRDREPNNPFFRMIDYMGISKDKQELLWWTTYQGKMNGNPSYYKKVTTNELKELFKTSKPQFDFLE